MDRRLNDSPASRRIESAVLRRPAPARRAAFADVLRRLRRMYGPVRWSPRGSGLDVLVGAMLSQNTNMANSRRGYRQLRRAFPTWPKVLAAPVDQVQRQIAICGLARQRARRLQVLLAQIKHSTTPAAAGSWTLDWLADVDPAQGDRLPAVSFHGVGPKTAAYTLLFGFNHPVLPVDNGILRVARRLRLVRPKSNADAAGADARSPWCRAATTSPPTCCMFRHAKERCRPKNPKCDACKLLPLCPHGQRRVRHRPPEVGVELLPPRRLARFASAGIPNGGGDDQARPGVRGHA